MMVDTIINSIGLLVFGCIISCVLSCSEMDTEAKVETSGRLAIAFVMLYLLILFILGVGTLAESVKALNDPVCEAAMKDTEGGVLHSASANIGSPLMANTGIAFGVVCIVSLATLIVAVGCCIRCKVESARQGR